MASSIYNSSDGIMDCNPCKAIHQKETEASFYCQECQEYLCPACRAQHKGVTLTTNHHVIILDPSVSTSSMQLSGNFIFRVEKINLDACGKSDHIPSPHRDLKFSKATLTDEFDASLDNDKEPCTLFDILTNDRLIFVADRVNNTMKLFYTSHAYVAQVNISKPYALTRVSDDCIAVSSGIHKKIHLLITDGRTVNSVDSITTTLSCYGICSYKDLLYVVCREEGKTPQIQVYTLEGTLERRIEPISQGKRVLYNPIYININPQNGNIYVTDWNNGVIGLTSTGRVLFVTRPPDLKCAQGITIDKYGQVYVCGHFSHNVVKMSHDGQDSVEILSKDPECRLVNSVNVYGNKMYLCCQDTNVVKVYTLS